MTERSTPEQSSPSPVAPSSASSSSARLEIRVGAHMHVVLEGEPGFVMEAYARVQDDVARALVGESRRAASLPTPAEPGETKASDPSFDDRNLDGSNPDDRTPGDEKKGTQPLSAREDLLWLYRCEDDLRTVYVTPRSRFAQSRLARSLGLGDVERVYVEDERLLRALRRGSRTLWREIEPAGKQRLQEAARLADTSRK